MLGEGETSAYRPTRFIETPINYGRRVVVCIDASGCFGLIFTNEEGEETRCQLSKGASDATLMSMQALRAGGGEEVKYEWRAVRTETLVRSKPGEMP